MKNRIFDWGKRYFLAVARSTLGPFTSGFMVIGLLAVAVFVVRMMLTPESESSLEVLFGHFQVALAICGLGVVVGGINYVVVKLFISFDRKGTTLFLAYKDREVAGGEKVLLASGNPMWFGKFWLPAGVHIRRAALPPTDRAHLVHWEVDSFLIKVSVAFDGHFDPREILTKLLWGYESFSDWMRFEIQATAMDSPDFRRILRDKRPAVERLPELTRVLEEALKSSSFNEALLANIKRPIEVAVSASTKFEV